MTMNIHIEDPVSKAITEMSPSKLSVRDVYFRLCTCLDREIELVWKRAVFLTAFLIAAFAGYGGLIATYIGINEPRPGTFAAISIAAIGIAVVGMALSVIWIMMAKGSKAWQEHYEKVIECFAKMKPKTEAGTATKTKDDQHDSYLGIFASGNYLATIEGISLANVHLEKKKISSCCLDCFGGPFSVSKIVIVLGRLFFTVWMGILFVHFLYLSLHHDQLDIVITRFFGGCHIWLVDVFQYGAIVLLILLGVTIMVYMCCRFSCGYNFRRVFVSDYLTLLRDNQEIKEENNG